MNSTESASRFDPPELKSWAEAEVDAVLESLPSVLREQARRVPVTLEARPNAGLQGEGIAGDTLGLFTGAAFEDELLSPMPPQIILFVGNLWGFVDGDPERFRQEVRTTFLHELGHYLGLDEDELSERGLD